MDLESSPPLSATERQRLVTLYRRWKRTRRQRVASAFHGYFQASDFALSLACLSFVVLFPMDCALWRFGYFNWGVVVPYSGAFVSAVLGGVFVTNGLLLNDYLARKTLDERSWPIWVRLVRFLFSGLPFVGFYGIIWWRRLREQRPEWSRRVEPDPVGPKAGGSVLLLRWRRWTDRLESSWTLIWLFTSGLGALLMAACWLSAWALESPAAYRTLAGVAYGTHLLLFVAMWSHFRQMAIRRRFSRGRRLALTALAALWLIPFPFLPIFVGTLLEHRIGGDQGRFNSLVFQILIRERDTARLPLWLSLEDRLQQTAGNIPWWKWFARPPASLDREPGPGRTERQIRRLFDLESYSLGFDAAALAWSLAWLAERRPEWVASLQRLYWSLLDVSLLLLLAGSAIVVMDFLQKVARTPGRLRLLTRLPWAGQLAKGQFAAAAGWMLGWHLRLMGAAQLGTLVMLCGALLTVVKGFTLVVRFPFSRSRSRRTPIDDLPGVLTLFALTILAGLSPAQDLLTPALAAWVLTYPLRALLLGLRLVPPLLRPFEWQDLASPDHPPRLRALLAFLAIPAVLPFGGLAVPAWILVRQRKWNAAKGIWLQFQRDRP